MRYLVVVLLMIFTISVSNAQSAAQKAYEKQYAKNIKKSRINKVYIPKDLKDAFKEIEGLSTPQSIAKFKRAPESVVASKLHFGLGKWISYNWNLKYGSRYAHYLKGLGLKNTDDMVQFTIVSFHRHLNNRAQDIETRIKQYDDIIQQKLEARKAKSETKIIATKKIKK